MSWDELKIEKILNSKLISNYGDKVGGDHYADYKIAKRILEKDVWNEIKGTEQNLTDHGPDHIRNVLLNAQKLLGDQINSIHAAELYCLCVSVLFHDTGNLHGRTEHQKKISDVYNHIRGNNVPRFNQERNYTLQICKAHCGYTDDGLKDTLKQVDEFEHLLEASINPRKIAAIVRLSDELAEGPQRTSTYMVKRHKYKPKSKIHHEYALITDIGIDRQLERIAVTYNFNIIKKNNNLSTESNFNLHKLLDYTYKRILKLEQERKYNRYYCDILSPFKKVNVQFNFYSSGNPLPIKLTPIVLSDIAIPGDKEATIPARDRNYQIDYLLKKLKRVTKAAKLS